MTAPFEPATEPYQTNSFNGNNIHTSGAAGASKDTQYSQPQRPTLKRSSSDTLARPSSSDKACRKSRVEPFQRPSNLENRRPEEHGVDSNDQEKVANFKVPQRPVIDPKRPLETQDRGIGLREGCAKKRPRIGTAWWQSATGKQSSPNTESPSTPPSPLFFSNTPNHQRHRPTLPPRFSSSEASAKMLSKTQGEDRSVKTVKLARGTPTSPSAIRPNARGRPSSYRKGGARTDSQTPSSGHLESPPRVLANIGVTELLDHDARPSFVVDLADATNYSLGGLQIVYANQQLHQHPDLIGQNVDTSTLSASVRETHGAYSAFKCWVLGCTTNGEPLKQQPASFSDNDVLWSCSTLRKRLRIISATILNRSQEAPIIYEPTPRSPVSSTSGSATKADQPSRSPNIVPEFDEPRDYFGNSTTNTGANNIHNLKPNVPMPSIEARSLPSDPPQTPPVESRKYSPLSNSRTSATSSNGQVTMNRFPAEDVLSAACAGDFDAVGFNGEKEVGFFDWTRLPVSDSLPKHVQFARTVDWASTALGPIEGWSADLRQMCNLIMASPHPAAMYWGEELVAIYNEAYVMLAGQKHPTLMGQKYREAWAEIWDDVKDVFESAQQTGQSTMKDDDCLFIRRNDFLEEVYFSWSIIPMVGGDGSVMGLYNPAFEKSRRKIAERRMLTLREVGERTAAARDVQGFWEEVLAALECNEFDTPFVLLYSLHGDPESDDSSIHSSLTGLSSMKQCHLEGALGVPLGHPAAPTHVDLQSSEGFVPILREVLVANKPLVLDSAKEGEIPTHLLEGLDQRGFHDPVRSVVVCPIHPTTGESTLGFLILGINPRRPFDEDYNLFVQLLSRQLATSLASVVLFEEEIRRGQQAAKLAALDRIQLSEQLAARTQEARDSETKFTRMAEFVPVGVFIGSSDGSLTYCNDSWFEISRVPPNLTDQWIDYVLDEDQVRVRQLWNDLVEYKNPASAEFRFKAPWTDRNGVRGDSWVIFSAYPEKDRDGGLKSVFGGITNISTQKWAEGLQKRKMEEAVELKRQQENFIDITSHEMRNPLSAILQCADEIILSIGERKQAADTQSDRAFCESNIDAAHTIALCAQHQKRIVDDVLTLSKLDSALLMVTPVDVQPVAVAQRALRMFEGEVQNADIEMKFSVDQSYYALNIDWCRLDPSRVLQVLINLTTNAIKFTTSESKRIVAITIAASKEKYSLHKETVVQYVPPRSSGVQKTQGDDWGTGEEVYIQFTVKDTGRGLSEDEKKLLFLRFSQASPRTHVQYGGSGLGLFISQQLTELQGGEIGVASEAGKGSTFAFFIRARKTTPPHHALEQKASKQNRPGLESKTSKRNVHSPKSKDFTVATPRKDQDENPRKEPLKVLIVEDNLVNQKVLQKQLKNMGCTTHVANHGGEAIERLRESWFWSDPERKKDPVQLDVVLMDQEMPVMDGLACTRKIREFEQQGKLRQHVPVIAVTANAREEQVKTAMDAGMDDVVSKPFRIPELIPKIEALVAKFPMPPSA